MSLSPVARAALHATQKRLQVQMRLGEEYGRLREEASRIRQHAVDRLPDLLQTFRRRLRKAGVPLIYAQTPGDVQDVLRAIVERHAIRRLVKSKSMVSEEAGVRPFLEGLGLDVWESDFGEFLVQLRGEVPGHLVAPAIHLTRYDAAETLSRFFGEHLPPEPEALMERTRTFFQKVFADADAGMVGANFLLAEEGGLVAVENEGNLLRTLYTPRVRIVLTTPEKLLPDRDALPPLLRLLALHATGQYFPNYVHLHPLGHDGVPTYVILLDHGRSRIWRSEFRAILRCIRCGACSSVCPVFRAGGGNRIYRSPYGGAMGKVLNPLLWGRSHADLPDRSLLCGFCDASCPVRIPLTSMIRALRTAHPELAMLWQMFPRGKGWRTLSSRIYRIRTAPPPGNSPGDGDGEARDQPAPKAPYPSSWEARWLQLLTEQATEIREDSPPPDARFVAAVGEAGVLVASPHVLNTDRDVLRVQGPHPFYPTLKSFLEAWDGQEPRVLFGGPSRTADIEKVLVLGAHGPRKVTFWLTSSSESPP